MERLNNQDIIFNLVNKLKNIRAKGISNENKKHGFIYLKCIFKLYGINFPQEKILVNSEHILTLPLVIDELIIFGYYLGLREYTFEVMDKVLLTKEELSINMKDMLFNLKYYIDPISSNKTVSGVPPYSSNWERHNPQALSKECYNEQLNLNFITMSHAIEFGPTSNLILIKQDITNNFRFIILNKDNKIEYMTKQFYFADLPDSNTASVSMNGSNEISITFAVGTLYHSYTIDINNIKQILLPIHNFILIRMN